MNNLPLKNSLLAALAIVVINLASCSDHPSYRDGALLYETHCSSCHQAEGEGLAALIPPLAGVDYLENNRDRLPCIIRYGISDTLTINGVVYGEKMEGIKTLSEIEITNLLNFVVTSWGNKTKPFRLDETKTLLEDCQ